MTSSMATRALIYSSRDPVTTCSVVVWATTGSMVKAVMIDFEVAQGTTSSLEAPATTGTCSRPSTAKSGSWNKATALVTPSNWVMGWPRAISFQDVMATTSYSSIYQVISVSV